MNSTTKRQRSLNGRLLITGACAAIALVLLFTASPEAPSASMKKSQGSTPNLNSARTRQPPNEGLVKDMATFLSDALVSNTSHLHIDSRSSPNSAAGESLFGTLNEDVILDSGSGSNGFLDVLDEDQDQQLPPQISASEGRSHRRSEAETATTSSRHLITTWAQETGISEKKLSAAASKLWQAESENGGVPQILKGMCYPRSNTTSAPFSQQELETLHAGMDIVYTWVNGSDPAHILRKLGWLPSQQGGFAERGRGRQLRTLNAVRTAMTAAAKDKIRRQARARRLAAMVNSKHRSAPTDIRPTTNTAGYSAWNDQGSSESSRKLSVEALLTRYGQQFVTSRDRESDELRYSLRSVDANINFNKPKGRLLLVSPGQVPSWMNHSATFFSGVDPNSSTMQQVLQTVQNTTSVPVTHLWPPDGRSSPSPQRRLVVVHQDSILPEATIPSFNTNIIEFYTHRLPGLSKLFAHFNDDYFVVREAPVTSFVNEYNGPIMRHEANSINGGAKAAADMSLKNQWLSSTFFTNAHIGLELGPSTSRAGPTGDEQRGLAAAAVVELPAEDKRASFGETPLRRRGASFLRVAENPSMKKAFPTQAERQKVRSRHFLKHAPFTLCRGLLEHFLPYRYGDIIARNGAQHKFRNTKDLIPPVMHNAFMMRRPYLASGEVVANLTNILQSESTKLHSSTSLDWATRLVGSCSNSSKVGIDPECGPAVSYIGPAASSILYILTDNMEDNKVSLEASARVIEQWRQYEQDGHSNKTVPPPLKPPLYLALNDQFTKPTVRAMMKGFLHRLFPHRSLYEASNNNKVTDQQAPLSKDGVFAAIMNFPLILVLPSTTAACYALRSLGFALPHHRGTVGLLFVSSAKSDTVGGLHTIKADACHFKPNRDVHVAFMEETLPEERTPEALVDEAHTLIPHLFKNGTLPMLFDLAETIPNAGNERNQYWSMALGQTIGLSDFVRVISTKGHPSLYCPTSPSHAASSSRDGRRRRGIAVIRAQKVDVLWDSFPLPNKRFEQ